MLSECAYLLEPSSGEAMCCGEAVHKGSWGKCFVRPAKEACQQHRVLKPQVLVDDLRLSRPWQCEVVLIPCEAAYPMRLGPGHRVGGRGVTILPGHASCLE